MYWNNPLIPCSWPQGPDVISELLADRYLLFYNPVFDFRSLRTNQRLCDLIAWANNGLSQGIDRFVNDHQNHYDIANLVKLNIWAHDIKQQGMVKPWLILDWGDGKLEAGTGESRLRLCEIMPKIQSVTAFISTHRSRANLYRDLEAVTNFDRFAQLCSALPGQNFLFRGTDSAAPFGVYWYEYDSELTRAVTPSQDWCVNVFETYYTSTQTIITPDWFLDPIDWTQFCKTDP